MKIGVGGGRGDLGSEAERSVKIGVGRLEEVVVTCIVRRNGQ